MKEMTLTFENYIPNENIKQGDVFHDIYEIASVPQITPLGYEWKVHHRRWDTDLRMRRPDPASLLHWSEAEKAGLVSAYQRHFIPMQLHPRIEAFYDVRHIGGGTAFFTEWTANGTLADCIADGSLYHGDEAEVAARLRRIAGQIARGLQFLQAEGLRHGAATAENVVITGGWNAKLSVANTVTLGGRGEEDDKILWALTVLELYLGHPITRDAEDALEHLHEYLPRMPKELGVSVVGALLRKLPTWEHVFAYLHEPLDREYGDCAAACRLNHALRLIDCGKLADGWNVLCELTRTVSGDRALACYDLMVLGQELELRLQRECEKLYFNGSGEPYQMLLAPQLRDRRETGRITEKYGDDLPAVLRQYEQKLDDDGFRAPYLHWQRVHPNQNGEYDI